MQKRHGYIKILGYSMHYIESGKGKPVICISGLAADSFAYRKNISSLARYFRVYAIDLIGSGLSDKPYRRYTLKFYTDQVSAFIKKKKIKQAVIIGTSWGGALAAAMALKYKSRISKLILIDSILPKVKSLPILGAKNLLQAVSLIHQGKRSLRWAERYLLKRQRTLYGKDKLFTKKELNHYFKVWKTPEGRHAIISTLLHCDFTPIIKNGSRIAQDTLIIWGAKDPLFPPEGAEWLHQKISSSQLKIIPDAGHCPLETKPKIVNRLIIDFIRG